MRARTLLTTALAAAQATSDLSELHRQWLDEEVPYIIIIIERERIYGTRANPSKAVTMLVPLAETRPKP